ncbi:MAG TPA: UDP-N-acetylmuramate--L-alanine ligase [Capillimicrobium sp.]|nr:UDP-N-acetylmuramate--L-alanine ligase [Capillimicrobium sp.]
MTDYPWSGRRLHVLGIGGAGMSAYALAARALGATVTGSDRALSPHLERVRAAGIEATVGHDAANLPAGEGVEVVISTAVPADNPELVAARERGLPVLRRAQLLGELTALRRTIAVAGAHGKTTTSSMTAHVLLACGLDPGYLIGGVLRTTGANGAWGTGEWLVVEADESDRSMLSLSVEVAVVTNVELDHHATFGSLAEVEADFRAFLEAPREAVIWDRPELVALRGDRPVVAYEPADVVLEPGGSRFSWRGEEVVVNVPGLHNARNATAALEAARLAGADPAAAAAAIAGFTGAGRRFERLGETPSGAVVVDDYAHHPTEVAATVAAARTVAGEGRVVAIFQPHLYSRTRALAREFGEALAGADVVAVLDVYPSRERAADFPGVTGRLVAAAAADAAGGRPVLWLPTFDDAQRVLEPRVGRGDVVLVLGAGDIDALGRRLVG